SASRTSTLTLVLGLCAVGLFIFLVLAVAFGLEGFVCVFMAMPLLLFALFLGAIIGYFCNRTIWRERIEHEKKVLVVVFPLLLLLGADRLSSLGEEERPNTTITSTITLPQEAQRVFMALQSMDTLDAERPWLLEIGLPVPYKCVLEGERVGAKRHCLFRNGHITAEITRYEPGELLSMSVTEYDLTGRHWFHFGDAAYTFEEMPQGTRVTRTSSYRSELGPRWYWGPLERMGIEQEHEFVLRSLKKNLDS
nr:SRPBCC family protein [Flavobacteriales bacterium]